MRIVSGVMKAMSAHGLLAINPACGIRTVGLFDGHRCVVVDDFLADPMGAELCAVPGGEGLT
ncbi:MAG: hypothetical protein ACOY41_02770 [Pseudomonadota bacterium]